MRQRQCRGLQAAANSPIAAAAPSRVDKAGQLDEEARGQGDACNTALHMSCTWKQSESAFVGNLQSCFAQCLQMETTGLAL